MDCKQQLLEMSRRANLSDAFAADFYERLCKEPEILEEFSTYLTTGNFTCDTKIEGYSILDIMIWQIDHFKAWLDRDTSGSRENKDQMVLLAFDTLLKMKSAPESYIFKMQSETGTDYASKSFFF